MGKVLVTDLFHVTPPELWWFSLIKHYPIIISGIRDQAADFPNTLKVGLYFHQLWDPRCSWVSTGSGAKMYMDWMWVSLFLQSELLVHLGPSSDATSLGRSSLTTVPRIAVPSSPSFPSPFFILFYTPHLQLTEITLFTVLFLH